MKTIKNLTADQLRKSILQLAIQGKLVKQDPNDEPASVLVEKIYAEKKKLIAEGKIKKEKVESYIYKGDDNRYYEKIGNITKDITDDLPFEIPTNWSWIRQKDICWLDNGKKSSGEKLPYLEAKVIRGLQQPTYRSSGIIIDVNDKVILVDGENSGEIMTPLFKGYMGSTFKIFSATKFFNYELLLKIFLLNKDVYKNSKTGSAIPHLNKDLFKNSFIAIPPYSEQERIVNKINLFEPLLDQYDKLEKQLTKLENEITDKLKKSVLQYAIEGKLVKQDPNDEPASVLLERIKAEKEKLIKEGKIKRDKNESFIYQGDDKNYYEKPELILGNFQNTIPSKWEIIRIKDCFDVKNGFTPLRSEKKYWDNGDINWFTVEDIRKQGRVINCTNMKINKCACTIDRIVPANSLLLCCTASIGEYALTKINTTTNQQFNALIIKQQFKQIISIDYLFTIAPLFKHLLLNLAGTTTFPFISTKKLEQISIPLPPLNEQQRIVDKIERIFDAI